MANDGASLWLYRALAGVPRLNYRGKIMLIAFIGTHIPLLALMGYFVTHASSDWDYTVWVLSVALGATLFGTGVTLFVLHHLLRPIELTSQSLRQYMTNGHLPRLPGQYTDEAGMLMADTAFTLNKLDQTLQQLVSELRIASQIQLAMLPKPRYAHASVQLAAALQPAKVVGGDLYDYFVLDSRRLLVAVGDVSDKGVPAALFMARTCALLKLVVQQTQEPSELLARLNQELTTNNDLCMFVTFFCAILHLDTGELCCASAGHDAALIMRGGQPLQFDDSLSGPALGLHNDAEFPAWRTCLQPGDSLLLYTDGITEAFNTEGEAFTLERLQAVLSTMPHQRAPGALIDDLLTRVHAFVDTAEPSDDITVLALTY